MADSNRYTAYRVLLQMEKNQSYSNLELNKQIQEQNPDAPALVRELVYGVLENRIYLDHLLKQLIPRGLSGVKKPVKALLRLGLYQLVFMDSVPDYAAVSETVRLARKVTPGREGFVNGVLRGYGRQKEKLTLPDRGSDPVDYLSVRYSCDLWIVNLWMNQYGVTKTEALLAAGNRRPLLSVRVNLLRTSRDALKRSLLDKGFQAGESAQSRRLLFVRGSGLLETEEYASGLFSVQDTASLLAAEILQPQPGETVYDICAAPGGKSLAMAEIMENKGLIRAFDIYAHKLALVEKESERLGISIIQLKEQDGMKPHRELDQTADRVLVDGPCSGLGVIRRKPEIKYKAVCDQGRQLAEKQLLILSEAARYVKMGGYLLYSTCTINKIENEQVVKQFLSGNREFQLERMMQLFPDEGENDGFFICKMQRKTGKGDMNGSRL
ncbi:16S rRNA (cytosine(967)-C(5))-methyltransferase RsmB [Ihubacter sp. rT4E-8]|uniref:16S rRNA (cytosine(967)-C(5))-methyltransferase RsmB n=1 Tax=Ihubacter sp. rT4E-8 TaxID=3242369 RepID=UPI003CFA4B76